MNSQNHRLFAAQLQGVVHSTIWVRWCIILSILLLGAVVTWTAVTPIDVCVNGQGFVSSNPKTHHANDQPSQPNATIAGQVDEVLVVEGRKVCQNDALIKLDMSAIQITIKRQTFVIDKLKKSIADQKQLIPRAHKVFETQMSEVRAERVRIKKEITNAEQQQASDLERAKAILEYAEVEFNRLRELHEKKAVPDADLCRARREFREAEALLAKAKISVNRSSLNVIDKKLERIQSTYELERRRMESKLSTHEKELEIANTVLEDLLQQQDQMIIRAPCDGTVTELDVHTGDWLTEGEVALIIAPACGFVFEAEVNDRDMKNLQEGQQAKIFLNASDPLDDGFIEGHVSYISLDASSNTNDEDQFNGRYRVQIQIPSTADGYGGNNAFPIKLGMRGTVTVKTGSTTWLKSLLGSIIDRTNQQTIANYNSLAAQD